MMPGVIQKAVADSAIEPETVLEAEAPAVIDSDSDVDTTTGALATTEADRTRDPVVLGAIQKAVALRDSDPVTTTARFVTPDKLNEPVMPTLTH